MPVTFRAIWKLGKVSNCRAHQVYQSSPAGSSSRPEFARPGSRASAPEGDLRNYGSVSPDPLENAETLESISFLSGAKVREGILTLQPVLDPAARAEAADKIRKEIHDHFSRELPHSPYVFSVHLDTPSPHAAVAFISLSENGKSKDIRPSDLRRWQDFDGADGLVPGRGSKEFSRHPRAPQQGEAHAMSIASAKLKGREEREGKLSELRELLRGGASPEALEREGRLGFRRTTKTGTPLAKPSLIFDGTPFRKSTLERDGHEDIARLIGLPGSHRKLDPEPVLARKKPVAPVPVQPQVVPSFPAKKLKELSAEKAIGSHLAGAAATAKNAIEIARDPAKGLERLAENLVLKAAEKIIPGAGLIVDLARAKTVEEAFGKVASTGAREVIKFLPGGGTALGLWDSGASLSSLVSEPEKRPAEIDPEVRPITPQKNKLGLRKHLRTQLPDTENEEEIDNDPHPQNQPKI